MTRWDRSSCIFAILVIGALATSVAAQPTLAPTRQPTQDELDQASAHFKAAEAAMTRHEYKIAVGEYLVAYRLLPDAEYLFDVGQAYRLAGDGLEALEYFEKYLESDPHGRGAADAQAAVDELRRSIAARKDAKKRKDDGRGLRHAGIVVGGAGLVALGVGVGFGLHARSISDETAGWDTFDPARFDQGKAAERNMFILAGVGVAALVTGGVLYYLGRRAGATAERSARSAVTFAPAIGPGEVTFTAVGRF